MITAQVEVLKKTGPLLTSGEIATRIGLASRQSVRSLKTRGRLLAISVDGSGESNFPEFQLKGSSVQEWIPKLLKRIPEGWSALTFLCANRKNLNGSSYLIDIARDPLKAGEMLARQIPM